jgi:hypothetical protein
MTHFTYPVSCVPRSGSPTATLGGVHFVAVSTGSIIKASAYVKKLSEQFLRLRHLTFHGVLLLTCIQCIY